MSGFMLTEKQQFQVGQILTMPGRVVSQAHINHYAKASGDMNPLHIDVEFARQTRFGGTIAHGLMSLAFVSDLMTRCFGCAWSSSGEMEISFIGPVRPGDTITTEAVLVAVDETSGRLELKVQCKNQEDISVITGSASVKAECVK
jgi:3-hydroxybutyryl-CoA dehydratase